MSTQLKAKYRVYRSFNFGTYRARTGNSHGPTPKRSKSGQGDGARRRSYLGSISR